MQKKEEEIRKDTVCYIHLFTNVYTKVPTATCIIAVGTLAKAKVTCVPSCQERSNISTFCFLKNKPVLHVTVY